MLRQDAIKQVLEEKQEKLREKHSARDKKIALLKADNKEFNTICDTVKQLGARLAVTALSGSKAEIDALKNRLNALNTEKEKLIKSAGIEEIEYDCPLCHDTGLVGDKICECVKQEAGEICLAELAANSPAKECRFDNFDLSFYTDEKAKNRMSAIFSYAINYARNFGPETRENLLFMGNTGLGKTHLSLAIAGEVIKKGYSVKYSPAYNLFGEIESEHFGAHNDKTYKDATACDLLIIDDLGGEFVSPYILSVVYNIINTRIISSKPTLINTNLEFEQLEERYTPRVTSRFIGEYAIKQFLGKDIRLAKKLGKK